MIKHVVVFSIFFMSGQVDAALLGLLVKSGRGAFALEYKYGLIKLHGETKRVVSRGEVLPVHDNGQGFQELLGQKLEFESGHVFQRQAKRALECSSDQESYYSFSFLELGYLFKQRQLQHDVKTRADVFEKAKGLLQKHGLQATKSSCGTRLEVVMSPTRAEQVFTNKLSE